MKQGWEVNGFEDCLEKIVYTNKVQRKDFLIIGKYPIISQEQDFINGYWDNSADLFTVKKPIIIFGDHTQVLKYVDFDFVLGADGVKILQPKSIIYPRFFYYFLQSINLGSLGYARHYRLLKEIEVHFPKSLPEQQRIVAILDEAFAAIAQAKANAEQNLKNTKELFESYLQSVFENKGDSWEEKTLGEVCNVIGGGTPSKANNSFYDGDIYWATVRDMKGELLTDTEHKITKDAVKNSSTNIIPKGNVIIATRVGLGKVCLIENDTAINQDLRGVIPSNPRVSHILCK